MPSHKMINGFIPRAPIGPHTRAIPPLGVEFSIAKSHHLRQRIQRGLEDGEEAGELDDERDGGELHEALEDGGEVERRDAGEGVVQQRGGVLGAGEPDEDTEGGDFREAFGDEEPADGGGAGVDGLVD